jgi:hypothetical protein
MCLAAEEQNVLPETQSSLEISCKRKIHFNKIKIKFVPLNTACGEIDELA